ncbi:MAG: hypothetical protein GX101_02070 [Firmicutes bacterium]|jgi:predicted nucleotide-binding protein (sugar kinase/HSP70/actin superfamily)|nr:acyl-CoA dehydratase activase-related protein [Bacillota bacterium]NLO65459.1 hypothetical protein [Bacillota bacterium]
MSVIGIPRALYYFHYYPLWKTYLEGLGFKVVFSSPTNKETLDCGLSTCVDGMCLPVKAYVGHVLMLARAGVDLIFVPKLVSVSRDEYICPNFLGLPDLVGQYLPPGTRLLSPVLDGRRGPKALKASYLRFGRQFAPERVVCGSWEEAEKQQRLFERSGQRRIGAAPGPTLLVLGPRYLLADDYLSGSLLKILEHLGLRVLTPAAFTVDQTDEKPVSLVKPFFWTEVRQMWKSVEKAGGAVQGLVTAAPFGCGAQALFGVLVRDWLDGRRLPILELHYDEHTSEVGMRTRLEAFFDLLERREWA